MRLGKAPGRLSLSQMGSHGCRIGAWKPDEPDESSNWREFTNVVEALEEEAASGRLKNCTICFFADNAAVEAALCKRTSKSKKLLALVIRVKLLETPRGIRIFVSHVSGNRMIAEGGDGISRGSLNEGVIVEVLKTMTFYTDCG